EEARAVLVAGWPMPVPESGIWIAICSLLSGTNKIPVSDPAIDGVKVTFTVHVAPGTIGEEDAQSSVSAKLPRTPRGPTVNVGSLPTFVNVRAWGALVVPKFWLPKFMAEGD